jgi:uncharacterized protein (TIGR02677 family)
MTDRDAPGPAAGRTPPPRRFNQVKLFQYVTAPEAPEYRALLQIFFDAKERYVIELRPRDILEEIARNGFVLEAADEEKLEMRLAQLVEWGNLTRAHDTARVATIEDFYRKRFVYHLTSLGEAAHRAVLEVEAAVGQVGSLQAGMLGRIRDTLRALAEAAPDPAGRRDLAARFHDLFKDFDRLAQEANRFIGELNRRLDEEGDASERFALRKQALLAYITRFVNQLRLLEGEIAAALETIETAGILPLLEAASRSADLPPGFGDENPAAAWVREQKSKWDGVRLWFVGVPGRLSSTVSRLAQAAVDAVVTLTRTLTRLNDRRAGRADRKADFLTLARWFSACPDDAAAHDLWRRAFGLYPARHWHIPEDDPGLAGPGLSWWDAPPVHVPVRLRRRGSVVRTGRPSPVPDRTDDKRWIAQRRRREREETEAALARFAGCGPLRLSQLVELGAVEFDLLLALLDEVLSAPRGPASARRARTRDGRLEILLADPPEEETEPSVEIRTPRGLLRCRDYRLTVAELAPDRVPRSAVQEIEA